MEQQSSQEHSNGDLGHVKCESFEIKEEPREQLCETTDLHQLVQLQPDPSPLIMFNGSLHHPHSGVPSHYLHKEEHSPMYLTHHPLSPSTSHQGSSNPSTISPTNILFSSNSLSPGCSSNDSAAAAAKAAEKRYECSLCKKSFKHKSTLYSHKKIHDDTSYTCHVCQKTFKLRKSLNNHMKTHGLNSSSVDAAALKADKMSVVQPTIKVEEPSNSLAQDGSMNASQNYEAVYLESNEYSDSPSNSMLSSALDSKGHDKIKVEMALDNPLAMALDPSIQHKFVWMAGASGFQGHPTLQPDPNATGKGDSLRSFILQFNPLIDDMEGTSEQGQVAHVSPHIIHTPTLIPTLTSSAQTPVITSTPPSIRTNTIALPLPPLSHIIPPRIPGAPCANCSEYVQCKKCNNYYCQQCSVCSQCNAVPRVLAPKPPNHEQASSVSDLPFNKLYFCDTCNFCFQDEATCLEHKKSVHQEVAAVKVEKSVPEKKVSPPAEPAEESSNALLCQHCGKNFKSERSQSKHKCTSLHKCVICNQILESNTSLEEHLKIHKQNPFQCFKCNITFSNKQEFDKHHELHVKSLMKKCPVCSYKSYFANKMDAHIEMHSKSLDGHKYRCIICRNVYLSFTEVMAHSATHGEDETFGQDRIIEVLSHLCKACDINFSSKAHLKKHFSTVHSMLIPKGICKK